MTNVILLISAVILFSYVVQFCNRNAVKAALSPFNENNSRAFITIGLVFFIAAVALLVVFAGFRTNYNDTFMYIHSFNLLDTTVSEYIQSRPSWKDNIFFNLLQIFIKQFISNDPACLVFISTIIPMVSLLLFFYRKTDSFGDCVFLFFSMGLMFFSMGAMKQFIAIGIGVWAIPLAYERKWFKFALVIFVAMMFHKYAFFYLTVLLFLDDDIWTWKSVIMLMIVVLIGFSFGTFAPAFIESTEDIADGYDMSYMEEGVSFFRVLVYAVPPAISFVCRKYVNENAPQYIKICLNLGIVTFLMILLAFFGGAIIFSRFAYYLEPVMYIGLIWLVKNCFAGKLKMVVSLVYYPAFLYYFAYNDFIHMQFNFRSLITQLSTY